MAAKIPTREETSPLCEYCTFRFDILAQTGYNHQSYLPSLDADMLLQGAHTQLTAVPFL